MHTSFKYLIPFAMFFALISFLWKGMDNSKDNPTELSVLSQGKKTPYTFKLPTVMDPNEEVTQDIFKGHVTVLTSWASWCSACRKGHDALLSLSKEPGVYWVGLNVNDKLEDAQWMLRLYGNPYHETIFDQKGQLSIDYGLRGTPEFLILDKEGRVQHRHMGLVNDAIWQEELLPVIKSLQ